MIKRSHSLAVVLFTVAAGLAMAPGSAVAQQSSMSQGTRIGVVNLGQAFSSMQERKDIQTKLEADNQQLMSDNKTHQAELQQMQEMIRNGPKPGTQQYDDVVHQYDEKTAQYAAELKVRQVELTRMQTRQLKDLFEKINGAVATIAKTRGLSLVITAIQPEIPTDVADITPEQISERINARNVMFVSPDIDITAEVVTTLDAGYKAGAK